MPEDKKCKCPLCEQEFTPESGLTPEEHIAKGIIDLYRQMQETKQSAKLHCPRCGQERMNLDISHNAVSRYENIYICYVCFINEALRASKNDILPITGWWVVSEIINNINGVKCRDYIPEKSVGYPLCDNTACEQSKKCNISAHMENEGGYSMNDK